MGHMNIHIYYKTSSAEIKFSNSEFKYMIEYATHKATEPQEAMGGKGAILCGWSD
jgi:hypothetical protein